MPRLPPLQTLRALEAAVRHRSYSKAARELNLTHGAVSHQLRRLEQDLCTTLFSRNGNAMLPTPAAESLATAAARAFGDLSAALEAVALAADRDPLLVSTISPFSSRWIGPRLGRIAESGMNLRFLVEDRLSDFVTDGVDVAIRYGEGQWPGVEIVKLFPERLFPVASPAVIERYGLRSPADLLNAPLLHDPYRPWSRWFAAVGLEGAPPNDLLFDDTMMMIDAAVAGMGVSLGRTFLIDGELRDGRLVRLFEQDIDSDMGFHLVWRADSRKLRRIAELRDWILSEVAGMGLPAP